MRLFLLILILFLFISNYVFSANLAQIERYHYVKGKVIDDETSIPLPGVTVRLADSEEGKFTDRNGEFIMKLPIRDHTFIFSMVGKKRNIFKLINNSEDTLKFTIRMENSDVIKGEVVVIAEDPGKQFMRKAIKKKQKQLDSLQTYTYMLYSKFVASTDTITAGRKVREVDTTIVSIFETYSKGYFRSPDDYFNEIIQRQQSVNIPPQANFVAFGTNLNAYDDFVDIVGEKIHTPFHKSSPDLYDFILDSAFSSQNNPKAARIIVMPMSNYNKLFRGIIILDTAKLDPISVELYPNEAVQLPFNAELSYKQNFISYKTNTNEVSYCFPERMHIFVTLDAEIFWIVAPRLDININTFAYDYEINPLIDDSKFNQRRVESLDSADIYDEKYWGEDRKIPLEFAEEVAYDAIRMAQENPDSVMSTTLFQRLFAPVQKQIDKLRREPFTGWEDILRFNRVQGIYLGLGLTDDIYYNSKSKINGGYSFSDDRINYQLSHTQYLDEAQRFYFTGEYYDKLSRSDDPDIVKDKAITPAALVFKRDYGDYYYNQGFEIGFTSGFGQLRFIERNYFQRIRRMELTYRNEIHRQANRNSDLSLLGWENEYRENPTIHQGNMSSIGLNLFFDYDKRRRVSDAGFYIGLEHSNDNFLQSDFNFTRIEAGGRIFTETFFIWDLDFRVIGGLSIGELPPQRLFSLEAPISRIATLNTFRGTQIKEFYGSRFVAAFFEHSFGEVIPGVFRIPNVASFGLEFIAFANAGWSDMQNALIPNSDYDFNSTMNTKEDYYLEAGLGINRLFIFFRFDVGYRFTQTPQFLITVTGATFN